jgi:hypothetical protein
MSKIYLVSSVYCDEYCVLGVFSTLELAQQFADKYNYEDGEEDLHFDTAEVEVIEVDRDANARLAMYYETQIELRTGVTKELDYCMRFVTACDDHQPGSTDNYAYGYSTESQDEATKAAIAKREYWRTIAVMPDVTAMEGRICGN